MKLNIKKTLVMMALILSAAAMQCINVTAATYGGNYIENNRSAAYSAAKESASAAQQDDDSGLDPQILAIGVFSVIIAVDVTAITVIICKRVKRRRKNKNKQSVNNSMGGENNG